MARFQGQVVRARKRSARDKHPRLRKAHGAQSLGSGCRTEDLPARLGGDEFGVLLPGIDMDGARQLASRVLEGARSSQLLKRRGVTVSAGVTVWKAKDRPEDLLRRADQALYAAKRGGGDTVASRG